jgi:hypothetical protein
MRRESVQSGQRPRRFHVGFVGYSKEPVTYNVSTWSDELMAVALTSSEHARRHPRSPINALFVEELDPLSTFDVQALPDGEIANLNEWR